MISSISPAEFVAALAKIRSMLRILQEQTSCHDLILAEPIESNQSRRRSGLGECVAESKKPSWRGQASPVAVVTTTGISDPAVASDSRRTIPGGLRRI